MRGACTTCTEMCWSGAGTGVVPTVATRPIRSGPWAGRSACAVAAAGICAAYFAYKTITNIPHEYHQIKEDNFKTDVLQQLQQSEEEEEGKKTIAEAIDANYPPQVPKPMEDEKAQLIDLSETLFSKDEETAPQPREHMVSTSAEEVIITVEDEPQAKEEDTPQPAHRPFGWIRRK